MEHAEFEEKQYETGLMFELAAGSPLHFSSGQVLEAALGYDFAVDPAKLSVWTLLQAGCPPGILLTPSLWPTGAQPAPERLPTRLVSLIIQAKRPHRLDHWRAGQHHRWQGPYFRFFLDERQQAALAHLESQCAVQALVRYASPAFLKYHELETHQLTGTIADWSSFVAPRNLQGHTLWSYAGPGTTGYANPEPGEELEADTKERLLVRADRLAQRQSLPDHLRALAAQFALEDAIDAEWATVLIEQQNLPSESASLITAWANVGAAIARAGSSWLVMGYPDREQPSGIREPVVAEQEPTSPLSIFETPLGGDQRVLTPAGT